MDKFFKRTLVGAAVAAAAVAGSANAAVQVVGDAVQFYGQAAGALIYQNAENENKVQADIESRIGFRGVVEFDELTPDFIWQMEGGNANNGDNTGGLGARDTYLGFAWDGFGSLKYGRQLVAAYNYVDWPHTNPGLGNVFDWNNDLDVTFQDRADHTIRYDSVNFGGFNVQATLSGMEADTDAMVASIAGSYSADMFSIHAGYYSRGEYKTAVDAEWKYDKDTDTWAGTAPSTKTNYASDYFIVGGSLFLGDFTFTGGYKAMNVETGSGSADNGQDAVSLTAAYQINEKWFVKAGYAATSASDAKDAIGEDDGDIAVTGRVGYLMPSAILYFDVRDYDFDGDKQSGDFTNVMFGAEYYF
ncbi:porin [Vibrio intestinalis]|uniref:porin n=1 Tax=Vibrio intestinalis TaxID=2933291 RepID=UPI0021A3E2C5|nr:porin [Vibrio intestinalis]